jgi:hypothetical protein
VTVGNLGGLELDVSGGDVAIASLEQFLRRVDKALEGAFMRIELHAVRVDSWPRLVWGIEVDPFPESLKEARLSAIELEDGEVLSHMM